MTIEPFRKPIPEGLDLIRELGDTVIVRKWYSWTIWFSLLFIIFWDSFLIIWYVMVFIHPKIEAFLIPIFHIIVGVYMTYYTICSFINSTRIHLTENGVKISIGPLPWLGNKTVERANLNGFIVRQSRNNQNRQIFKVVYVSQENREKTLYSGFQDRAQTEYVADYLSYYYKTPDRTTFQ